MSTEQNKALVRRFVEEAQTQHRVEAVYEYLSPGFVDHSKLPGFPDGRDGVAILFNAFFSAFPDLRAVIHDQIAEGDRVVTRKTLLGTHHGAFMGIPPTGKPVQIEVIDILRIVNGAITDHWNVVDQLGLLQQLGAAPTPQPVPA